MGCGAAKERPTAGEPSESKGLPKEPMHFLLMFDVGQTLFNNPGVHEELLDKQGAAFFSILLEKLGTMKPEDRTKLGLGTLPIDKIKEETATWQAKFLQKFKDRRNSTRTKKNQEGIAEETTLASEIFTLLTVEDCFECKPKPAIEADLKKFCEEVTQDDKCVVAKYEVFDHVGDVLEELKQAGVVLTICTNSPYAKTIRSTLDTMKLTPFFKEIIISSEVGVRKPSPELAQLVKKKFSGYKDYEMCMIGDMLDRDILCGQRANMRTLWYIKKQFDPKHNYTKLKDIKPDFLFSQYKQLPYLVRLMAKDAAFIKAEEISEANYRKAEQYKRLPSSRALKCAYYYPKKKDPDMAEKGVSYSNEEVVMVPFLLDCPFELQGPFDIFIHKAADLMIEEYQKKQGNRFSTLMAYTEGQKATMITVDPLPQVLATLLRTTINKMLSKAFEDAKVLEIAKKYHIEVKQPYYKELANKDPETSYQEIMADVAAKRANFPFFIKLAESCQTVESHTLAICLNADGLKKGLAMDVYRGNQLIVQQFVKHNATVYKIFTIGKYTTYHFKKSLPSDMGIQDVGVFNSQKPFPKEWMAKVGDVKDRINKDLMKELTGAILDAIDMSLVGLDYVIEEETGNYYIIDLNYFTSYRHEPFLNKLFTDHLVALYGKKIKRK